MDASMSDAFRRREAQDGQPISSVPVEMRYEWLSDGTCTVHVEVCSNLVRSVTVHNYTGRR